MKKRHLLSALILLIAVGATLAWRYWPRTVPLEECSELYRRYCDNPHIAAAFLKDFRVNDSVTVDATLLEAVTDKGWDEICRKFNMKPYSSISQELVNEHSVSTRLVPRDDFSKTPDSILSNNYLLVTSRHTRAITIFDIRTEEQLDAIFNYHIIKTIKNEKENTCLGAERSPRIMT